ncbi:MAG: hypothetical protein ACI94Y_003885, partial [Maribacter sp.]
MMVFLSNSLGPGWGKNGARSFTLGFNLGYRTN